MRHWIAVNVGRSRGKGEQSPKEIIIDSVAIDFSKSCGAAYFASADWRRHVADQRCRDLIALAGIAMTVAANRRTAIEFYVKNSRIGRSPLHREAARYFSTTYREWPLKVPTCRGVQDFGRDRFYEWLARCTCKPTSHTWPWNVLNF